MKRCVLVEALVLLLACTAAMAQAEPRDSCNYEQATLYSGTYIMAGCQLKFDNLGKLLDQPDPPAMSSQQKPSEKAPEKKEAGLISKSSSHSVTLTCIAPPGNVNGYYFYRGTATGGENYTTPINSTIATACSYVDTQVIPLTTYYYTVKASCSTCTVQLSGPSNEASGTIPGDPQLNPPTGLSLTTQ